MQYVFMKNLFLRVLIFSFCVSTGARAQTILSLERALEIAMENSPNIKQAKLRLEQSRQQLIAQEASLKSQFSLRITPFSYKRDRMLDQRFLDWYNTSRKSSSALFSILQPIKWTDGTLELTNGLSWQDNSNAQQNQSSITTGAQPTKYYRNDLLLSYTQPLFTYNRTQLELKSLKLNLENSALSYAIQRLSIEQQVKQQFYNVYYRKMSRDISREEFKNNEESYQIIQNKVEAGISAKEELYQAELNLASSRSSMENAQVELENAMDNLKLMLDLPLDEEISATADVSHYRVEVDQEKATAHALKSRMELRQRDIEIQNAMQTLVEKSALNEFKGELKFSYGLVNTNEEYSELYEDPDQSQQFSVALDIPLWDWGQKKATIKASEASLEESKLNKDNEKNNVLIELRKAFRALKNQITQIDIARTNVKNAELTYEINLERYKNGDLTSKDLGYYQNQLSREKLGYIEALINYRLALLDIKIQSLWDFEKNKSVVQKFIF